MNERRVRKPSRKVDMIGALLLQVIAILTKITTACAGLFAAGAAAIITARGAWLEVIQAFIRKP